MRTPKHLKVSRRFVVEEIRKRRGYGNTSAYLVQWKGYTKPTWVEGTLLLQDVPHLVRKFESDYSQKWQKAFLQQKAFITKVTKEGGILVF